MYCTCLPNTVKCANVNICDYGEGEPREKGEGKKAIKKCCPTIELEIFVNVGRRGKEGGRRGKEGRGKEGREGGRRREGGGGRGGKGEGRKEGEGGGVTYHQEWY